MVPGDIKGKKIRPLAGDDRGLGHLPMLGGTNVQAKHGEARNGAGAVMEKGGAFARKR